jgi:hypothetical protein
VPEESWASELVGVWSDSGVGDRNEVHPPASAQPHHAEDKELHNEVAGDEAFLGPSHRAMNVATATPSIAESHVTLRGTRWANDCA